MNRQKQLLALLAGLFVLALAYAFWATPRQQRVERTDAPAQPRRPAPEAQVSSPAEGTRVRLDLLSREEEGFAGSQRDIFNYPPEAPPPRTAEPATPPPPAQPPEAEDVSPEVEEELARFTFLGSVKQDNVETVFLSSGEEIFLVKRGEYFGEENAFQVTDLTPERLIIRHREDPRVITIPLTEQAPLSPWRSSPASPQFSPPEPVFMDQGEDFVSPDEEPMDEEDGFSPPPAEEENGFSPDEETREEPETGEGGFMGNEMPPLGGADDE